MAISTPFSDLREPQADALADPSLRLALRRAFGVLASPKTAALPEAEYRAAVRGAAVQVVKALEQHEQQRRSEPDR